MKRNRLEYTYNPKRNIKFFCEKYSLDEKIFMKELLKHLEEKWENIKSFLNNINIWLPDNPMHKWREVKIRRKRLSQFMGKYIINIREKEKILTT